MSNDDLLAVLGRFHREVMVPEMRQALQDSERRIRDEMLSHFDALYQRLGRLESEYASLTAAVSRIETLLGSGVSAPKAETVREQIRELKEKVSELQRRIDELESSAS